MKKLLIALILVGASHGLAKADELSSSYDTNGRVHYELTAVTASTQAIMIRLNDTTNYPHFKTGGLAISGLRTTFDTPANSSGTIKYGVVTFVNASTGTVKWFANYPFFNGAASTFNYAETFAPTYLRTLVRPVAGFGGTTPYFSSNSTTNASTTYQNDVNLPTSVGGNSAPAIGDIIIAITFTTGSINDFSSEISYAAQNK